MKKLLVNFTSCIIVLLLISSCASNISIVKRYYRGGYYVDYNKKAPIATRIANAAAKTKSRKRASVASISSRQKQNAFKGIPDRDILAIPNTLIAMKKNVRHKNSNRFTEKLIKQSNIAETPVLQKEQTLSESIAGGSYGGGDERTALSLLWIVIIVILVLWLIGILAGGFGLGVLINVLLIVALVLLILWLLRVA